MGSVIAQSASSGEVGGILLWVGVLIGLVVVASIGMVAIRRHFLGPAKSENVERGFLDDLRAMRDSGEISAEEFDLAKRSMVNAIAGRKGTKTEEGIESMKTLENGGADR
ncbi:MAG: hypothetical protein CMJ31_13575 [Phycisphaerae bacterium]|nr:hypothetical protein [Phycisphaerae bacterium]